MLDAALRLVDLQADAEIPAGDRDFTGYVAKLLFQDWDEVWADAPQASTAAGLVCARLRRWLQPVWGLRLPPADYAHNDLNLSNILTDGALITGVVDWDEFGLGCRALDLVALALDLRARRRSRRGRPPAGPGSPGAGDCGLRCLVSYRAIALLAHFTRERQAYGNSLGDEACAATSAILDRLQATGTA
jgi:aminoglycoside phosphotransferase (APT) family kinase protein